MEYQKLINLLDSATNPLSKFRTKNWVEIREVRGMYNTNSQIKFKTKMLKSSLCDTYTLLKETTTTVNKEQIEMIKK